MWSLSKSRRRHDRWEIALAKWGPKAASKCWRNGIHISLPLLPGDRPLSFFYWILTTHYTSIFRPEQHICIYTEDSFIFAFHEEKKTGVQTPFILRCDLSTFSFEGKQSLSEQKQRWGPRESPHNFYVVESAKGVCYFWGSLQPPPWHTTGCPEIHCDASQQN